MTSRIALLALLISAGCGGETAEDAGMDAGDAAPDGARIDAPPAMCTPACGVGDSCCDILGETSCLDLRNDPTHCGRCDVNCLVENRGDDCSASTCTCGTSILGCSGMSEDFCCPARGGSEAYCANLDTSPVDCGDCGDVCDPARADRCDGGTCRCGVLRGQCDGTPESLCCQVGVDIDCVDTTSDTFHCGVCNNLCQTGESCQLGTCTTTTDVCAAGCDLGEICCSGECCSRRSCLSGAGMCIVRSDGGMPDGGMGDAGAMDAAIPDGGSGDAAVPDAGTGDAAIADGGTGDAAIADGGTADAG